MINYAVVGAGWISQHDVPARGGSVWKFAGCAIVTGDRAKAARLADFYGIGCVRYDGYDALWQAPDRRGLHRLAEQCHADYAIRAARAGKHVMSRKPLAVSEDEATRHDRRGGAVRMYFS